MRDEEVMMAVLAEHEYRVGQVAGKAILCVCGWHGKPSDVEPLQEVHRAHVAAELARAGFGSVAAAKAEALDVVRLVERDMAEQALAAWRSADARRGLSDHAALEVHADALTRWSERLRMAMQGQNYRADQIGADQ